MLGNVGCFAVLGRAVADGVEGGVPEVKERLSASDRIDAVKDEAGKLSLLSWALSRFRACWWMEFLPDVGAEVDD